MRKNLAPFALLFVLLTNFAFSQGIVTGSVSGTVQDQQGAAIPHAAVTAVQAGTNAEFKTESDAQGYEEIPENNATDQFVSDFGTLSCAQ